MSTVAAPTLEGLRQHREAILQTAAEFGAENVRVIGSVARGEAEELGNKDLDA